MPLGFYDDWVKAADEEAPNPFWSIWSLESALRPGQG